ncbi:integrase [Enterococcus canis]|uniref:Integrase n=1 Tax=Enterococcus canis TaxID=214095 RepID=A0A1L8RK15_9ENTE|nr:IS30 family transposase [Enterococcus canis]OJG20106.1 integrase [Enterococcus canis]
MDCFKTKGFSPDAAVGFVRQNGLFAPHERISTTTLYRYIDEQRLEIRNIHLQMKVTRRTNKKRVVKNRKLLGKSIEERPLSVESREEFGHFEIDTVNGKRDGSETALLTLTERKTRLEIIRAIDAKDADSVTYAIQQLISEYGYSFSHIFRSITADNGSEFAQLSETLTGQSEVYFTHPYTSCERGTNENHNRMIRRYIPKGMSIDQYDRGFIQQIAAKMNRLPRKILNYATPEQCFEQALQIALS